MPLQRDNRILLRLTQGTRQQQGNKGQSVFHLISYKISSHFIPVGFYRFKLQKRQILLPIGTFFIPVLHFTVNDAAGGEYETPSLLFPLRVSRYCFSRTPHPGMIMMRPSARPHQFGNQRNTFNGIRLLAGSQDTVASEFNPVVPVPQTGHGRHQMPGGRLPTTVWQPPSVCASTEHLYLPL